MRARSQESLKEQTHSFIAFILFPAVTETPAVPEGRASALWAKTNDESVKFAKYIRYCFNHIVFVEKPLNINNNMFNRFLNLHFWIFLNMCAGRLNCNHN